MGLLSGTVEPGEDPTPVCAVPENGVRLRNTGEVTVWLGGEDVTSDGSGAGFPLEPGQSETFPGAKPKESALVPAPPGDAAPPTLYARTEKGSGTGKIAWFTA